jgi:hypothetical protein
MAQIIRGGNAAVHAMLYGDVHPGTQRFFESQRGQGLRDLTQTAVNFMKDATDRFGFMATEATRNLIRNVRRKASWAWHGDFIRPLSTMQDLQLAPPRMIRYLMAEPTARRMYHNHQIAGYDEDYVDPQPGVIGEGHYEYRQVMDGILEVDEETGNYIATNWLDDTLEDESPLEFSEQLDILESWGQLTRRLEERLKDPTSLRHASLE